MWSVCVDMVAAVGADVPVPPADERAKIVAKVYGGPVLELPPDPQEDARRRRAKAAAKARRAAGEANSKESAGGAAHRQFLEGMIADINAEVCLSTPLHCYCASLVCKVRFGLEGMGGHALGNERVDLI